MSEANEKADVPEELELERELHRECSETERGDVDLAGMAIRVEIGAARTGPLFISSASTWKSNRSSSMSFPMSCWAKVLVEPTVRGTKLDTAAAVEAGSAVQTLYTIF